jgi:competence protein ComEC
MCVVYLAARLLYRDRAMTNEGGAAAFGLLVFDPRQLFTASFQMTFLCVLIVAAIGIPLLERTSQHYRQALTNWDSKDYAVLLPPRVAQFRLDLQLISARLALFAGDAWAARLIRSAIRFSFAVWDLLFITAAMQTGLALPMAYYFHRATTIGLPANLIVVPLTQWMMPAAVLALALGYVSLWLAKLPVLIATVALNGITGTIQGLGGLHLADLRVGMPSAVMITLAVASLILAMWTARRRIVLTSVGLVAVFLVSLALAFVAPRPDKHSGVMESPRSTSARAIRSSSLLRPGRRFSSMPEVPLAPVVHNSTSEKMWSRLICGNEASLTSTRWRLPMGTPITSAA